MNNEAISMASADRLDVNLPELTQQATQPPLSHAVQPGEDVQQIAESHNVSEQALRHSNDLGPGQAVYPGTVLTIPVMTSPQGAGAEGPLQADAVKLHPLAPEGVPTEDADVAVATPDLKSMSPQEQQQYLKSPEFQRLAASDRQAMESLYNAGMKDAAAKYMADRLQDMPPHVAAEFAKQWDGMLKLLSAQAGTDKKILPEVQRIASVLSSDAKGRDLVQGMANALVAGLPDNHARVNLLNTLRAATNSSANAPLNLALLNALRADFARAPNGAGQGLVNQADAARNQLMQTVVRNYNQAISDRDAKDAEFKAILERVNGGLTDAQRKALYDKFMSDPANKAVYERAAALGQEAGNAVAMDPQILTQHAASGVPGTAKTVADLIGSLARDGQGTAAMSLLLAIKSDPAATASMAKASVNLDALGQKAGAAAVAEEAVKNGGDVKQAINTVLENMNGALGHVDSTLSNLKTMLDTFSDGSYPTTSELKNIMEQAGPWLGIMRGVLGMACALTAPDAKTLDVSIGALIEQGDAGVGLASDIVEAISSVVSKETKFGTGLATASKHLDYLGKVFSVLAGSKQVIDGLTNQLKEGANPADVLKMLSGLAGIAAAFPTPASPALALISVILSISSDASKYAQDQAKLRADITKYLIGIGVDDKVAAIYASNPSTIGQLAGVGYDGQQIQALAARFPSLFGNAWAESGFTRLTASLKQAGSNMDQIMQMMGSMDSGQLQEFCEAVGNNPQLLRDLGQVTNKASLLRVLEQAIATLPPGHARDAAQRMRDLAVSQ